jgi:hypothetical protein
MQFYATETQVLKRPITPPDFPNPATPTFSRREWRARRRLPSCRLRAHDITDDE